MPKATLNEIVGDPDRRLNLESRFWPKVSRRGPDECWPWIAKAVHPFGYGRMTAGRGTHLKAHRVSYALAHGGVPDGLGVLHRCDNPSCCNPSHLFVGTQADNMHDAIDKGRFTPAPRVRGDASGQSKIKIADIPTIQADRRPARLIADEFGVSTKTVHHIRSGLARVGMQKIQRQRRPHALLTVEQIVLIRSDRRSQREIAESFGICQQNVSDIKRRVTWKQVA